jgi:hypothetical protein
VPGCITIILEILRFLAFSLGVFYQLVQTRSARVVFEEPPLHTAQAKDVTVERVRRSASERTNPAGAERDTTAASYGAIALLAATLALSTWLFPKRVMLYPQDAVAQE